MVLVMKLSAFGWNVYDGKAPKSTLSEFGRLQAVRQHPDLLSYLGFVFFYASLLTGPSFHYNDYDRFIKSILFDDVPESKRPGRRVKRRIPRSGISLVRGPCKRTWVRLPTGISLDTRVFVSSQVLHNMADCRSSMYFVWNWVQWLR